MSLATNSTDALNCVQAERISDALHQLKSHIEDLRNSLKEVQVDLFYVARHLKDLEEAFYAIK